MEIHLIFDSSPGPDPPGFIEAEDATGRGVSLGEWRERDDGYWELVFDLPERKGNEMVRVGDKIRVIKEGNSHGFPEGTKAIVKNVQSSGDVVAVALEHYDVASSTTSPSPFVDASTGSSLVGKDGEAQVLHSATYEVVERAFISIGSELLEWISYLLEGLNSLEGPGSLSGGNQLPIVDDEGFVVGRVLADGGEWVFAPGEEE